MKDTDKIRRLTVEERKIWVEVSRELRELERRAADLTQNLEEAAAVGELEPIARVRGAVRGGFPTGLTAVRWMPESSAAPILHLRNAST